jgi:hypothetical protein
VGPRQKNGGRQEKMAAAKKKWRLPFFLGAPFFLGSP